MHKTDLQGHHKVYHDDPNVCGSRLLYLHRLALHYPNIQTIISTLYSVRSRDGNLCAMTIHYKQAMLMHRSAILRKISRKYSVTCDAVDESKIRKAYAKAMTLFNEWNSKNPEYPCISLKARYTTHLRNIKDTDSEGALQDHFRKDACGSVDNITVQLLHRLTPRSNGHRHK